MKDYECPYCEFGDDYAGDGLGQDESTEVTCVACEKTFLIMATWSVSYDSSKADCLNGSPHNLRRRHPFIWNGNALESCSDCEGHFSRPATSAEIEEYGDMGVELFSKRPA